MKPDPTARPQSPRRRPHRPADLAAFLEALALTGNFALAARAIGRTKGGLYKRRARDPAFAAACAAALAKFHSSPHRGRGVRSLQTG
ncbi:hypothetical protein [Sphingomicrobium astaxanthinifaciens]|uniref:hypothetical protein n=1 Tax=Sphingomicrobium astaxanthinifaciens TaxID=1227949 RepID=UPI001FCAC608|nr:hypothetical protein [Sphingomicrobium astaxanthinifaciens]MCJ7421785.1 hypothetical protein [Sphingomicrobium astaxanthinifaciens]